MERNLSRRCAPFVGMPLFFRRKTRYNTSIRIRALGKGENIFAEISSDYSLAGINLAYYTLGYGLCHPLNACFFGAGAVFLCFYGLCVSSWDTGAMESGTRRNVAGHAALSKRKWALLAAGAQRRGDFAFDPAAHAAVHNPYAVWRVAAPLWCAESFVVADAERGAGCACSV